MAGFISALRDIGVTLEVLRFELSSKSSKALGMCVDDPVLHMDHPIAYALRTVFAFGITKKAQVELKNVWFASGILDELRSELDSGQLEVFTAGERERVERPLTGNYSAVHLSKLGLDQQDVKDAEALQEFVSDSDFVDSMPSSLNTALSELDRFFIAEYLNEEPEGFQDLSKREGADSISDGTISEIQDIRNYENANEGDSEDTKHLQTPTLDDEELTEDDDIEDEEMIDIDNIDAIIGHMEAAEMQRMNMKDVCYMTNFAPDLLGKWV